MFLTKECDYGVRIIRALADGNKKTVEVIAEQEHIPKKYAYKIVKKLERGGFICSIRGRSGGYQISKPLSSFTLVDVVVAIDPDRYINECLRSESECHFKHQNDVCLVHQELARLQDLVITALNAKTMDKILHVDDKSVT